MSEFSCPPCASEIQEADPWVTAWGLRVLVHLPRPLKPSLSLRASPQSCPPAAPLCTHVHVVLKGLGGYQVGGFLEVLAGRVEAVLLQIVLQQALLDQVLPHGLLSDKGNPAANVAKGWFEGGGVISQGVCSWGAVGARQGKGSWPKREAGRRESRWETLPFGTQQHKEAQWLSQVTWPGGGAGTDPRPA